MICYALIKGNRVGNFGSDVTTDVPLLSKPRFYLISFEVFQFGSCFLEKGPSFSYRIRHFFDISRIQMKIFRFWKFCFTFTNNLNQNLYQTETNTVFEIPHE